MECRVLECVSKSNVLERDLDIPACRQSTCNHYHDYLRCALACVLVPLRVLRLPTDSTLTHRHATKILPRVWCGRKI